MFWINFLHFYQPPIISDDVIEDVFKSSYSSWVKFLNRYKKVKITANINGCLTERLSIAGHGKFLESLARIAERGQIEFVESAAFHPILPLLPEKEVIKQIQINNQINKSHFGKVYKPRGFYLPEMAYSLEVAKIIKKLGYKYIILDQIAFDGSLKHQLNNNLKYKIKNLGLGVVFRNRKISQTFVPETIINILEGRLDIRLKSSPRRAKRLPRRLNNSAIDSQYIITATDGELYGHKYWNWWPAYAYLTNGINKKKRFNGLKKFQDNNLKVETLTVSEYLSKLKEEVPINPVACSWESTEKELKKGIPYAVWQDPKNKIHTLIWQLADFALNLNWRFKNDPNHFASRLHLEKGLASCTFWWASGKDFKMFSPHAWLTSMVEVGAHELLNSVRSLEKIDFKLKLKAEKLFSKIRDLVWYTHWKK